MIRRSTLVAVEILLGLIAALAIGLGVAWWRLSQGPLELGFIREHIQTELSAARAGRPVGIERVELALSRNRIALELRAVGVSVQDENGRELSRAEEARIELGVFALLLGRIAVAEAEFKGGEITLTRTPSGETHIAFGPEGASPDVVIPASPEGETLEQRVARLLDGMEAAFRPIGPGGRLRELAVREARLTIVDQAGGGRWTADAATFELARNGRTLTLEVEARLEGAEGPAPARLRVRTDTQFQAATIEFGADEARPRALFSPAALGPFAGLDAPLTATVLIGLDRETGVNRFEGDVTLGRGAADMAGGRFSLDGGAMRGRYDIASDELILDQLSLGGATTRINGEVRVRDVSAIMRAAPDEPAAFNITFPAMRLDVPGTFAEPVALSNVEIVGAIVSADRAITLTRLRATTGEAELEGAGRFYWAEVEGRMRPGLALRASASGAIDAREVLNLWPIGLGEGARGYLARTITGGRVSELTAAIDIRPADIAAGVLRNEALDVRFNIADASMQFISTMSPVTNVRGSGVLRGNRFEMMIPEARFNNLAVTNGRIEAPQLKPSGAMLTIAARVEGEARNILEVLEQEPLELGEQLPVETASASGRGVVSLRLQRPMRADVDFADWRFAIDGQISNFSGQMAARRVALANGNFAVRGDQRAVTISGPVRAGESQISDVRWTEHIGRRGRASSEYVIAGDFDANDLERLGYPVAAYAQGRIGVAVTGEGRGFDVDQAQIELDLTNAAVEAPRGFWVKRAGQPASARFAVERLRDGAMALNNIDARGAGLFTQGRAVLARDGRLMEAELARLVIEGRSNARISAARASDGALEVAVRGALFDGAPFMGADSPPEAGAARAGAPLRASVFVDRLKLRGGATLSDARVELSTRRGALTHLIAEGSSPGGRAFSLALGPRPGEPQGGLHFRADDAGFAVRALTGAENVVGGSASAEGDWRGGPPNRSHFTVRMRDFQVVRLPAMARLLSSAGSLTGLVEMLNGDGIGFTLLEADMVYAGDQLRFTEGRMTGPSLGLTGAGSYDLARDNLTIDGVAAPSPVLNLSVLGGVPVIGDLLVSRRGEGVFGVTYTINGAAASPRVGVNPVSALTPGILRRIFEPVAPRMQPDPAGEGDATQDEEAALETGGAGAP